MQHFENEQWPEADEHIADHWLVTAVFGAVIAGGLGALSAIAFAHVYVLGIFKH